MSTQSVRELSIDDVSVRLDKVIANIAIGINREDKLGVSFNISKKDLFLLRYYQDLIQSRLCVSDKLECGNLSVLNKIINRYI